jgi:hypothetical protein
MLTIKKNIQPFFFLNFLLALYPLAYTLGNLAINLLTVVIIILSLYKFRGKILPSENKNLSISLNCFFFYLILVTFL